MAIKYVKGKLYKLQINALQADPVQARKYMDPIALNELTASIQKLGVLTPIQFRLDDQEALFIVSGHRRVKAAGHAGLTEINATFTDGDTRLQGFVENLQRESLTPIDEAEEMDALMKEYAFNQYQLAAALGKGQSSVSETLSLNRLPEDIRSASRTNPNIPKTMLLDVAKLKNESSMRRKFQKEMEKAAQAGKPAVQVQKQKPALSTQRALITEMDGLTGKLGGLPWREWSEDDRNDVANAAAGIRRAANELLADMNWSSGEGEEGEPDRPPSTNLA